jgi:hypothetical protein
MTAHHITRLGLVLAVCLAASACIEGKDRSLDGGAPLGDGLALDPRLQVPPAQNEVCSHPGSMGECSWPKMCTFFNKVDGRCVECTSPVCGKLGDSCARSADCDAMFACFDGRCTSHCILGSVECGPRPDCLDIGHPVMGVCKHF